MKSLKSILLLIAVSLITISCSDPLDYQPKGVISDENLDSEDNINKLVNAAYASLGNDHWNTPYTNMWPYGSVRADDSYKGGLGTSDQGGYHQYEIFSTIRTDMSKANDMWERLYIGVQRANVALKKIKNTGDEFSLKNQRIGEMRFLRGHFHFLLKKLFKRIPYIDDTVSSDSLRLVSNVEYSNDELWNKIASDFQFAVDNLPPAVEQVGRPNQVIAKAYLAKVRLFQAYEQDEQHNVTNINSDRLQEVVNLTTDVINSGKYSLFDDYAMNFLWSYENGEESLYAVQRSRNDGTPAGRVDMASQLNWPMYEEYGCCSFNRPSFNFVNAFQTNQDGIPKFETYNNSVMKDSADFQNNTFDPRLDHTVGLPSHPYKYQQDVIYNVDGFTRGASLYGPFSDMKPVQKTDCPCLVTDIPVANAYLSSSKNNRIIRFDEVLLWKAEALIELDRHTEALPLINQIRVRAKNSKSRLTYANGDYMSNYNIEPYKPGVNISWTQENARRALRWERRLEFGMEGVRFFDLVRWGIAAETLNEYFEEEKNRTSYLENANFTEGRDEYLPIPQQQIDFSNGNYEQNHGW